MSGLDQDTLRALVHYEPTTGVFTWLPRKPISKSVKMWNGKFANKPITILDSYGYIQINITINGVAKHYKGHRLAWLYVYGEHPKSEIDHVNQIRTDNRISNLRLASKAENQYNVTQPRKHNMSGEKGVKWCPRDNNYMARIVAGGKEIYLGKFKDIESAKAAYSAAHIRYAKQFSPYLNEAAA